MFLAVGMTVACTTTRITTAERDAMEALKARRVDSLVGSRYFGIEVNAAFPQRGSMQRLNYDYGIQVHGDTLRSYLPYFGRAYQIPYGGGKGLDFEAPMKRWELQEGKNGQKKLVMWAENEEDAYVYTLKIYSGGNIDLTVDSRQRDRIHYTGRIVTESDK